MVPIAQAYIYLDQVANCKSLGPRLQANTKKSKEKYNVYQGSEIHLSRERNPQSVTMWRAGRSALLQGRKFLDKVILFRYLLKNNCVIDHVKTGHGKCEEGDARACQWGSLLLRLLEEGPQV